MQQQNSEKQSINTSVPVLGKKSLENLLSYHPIQPYPFTFINAVKQKLSLGDYPGMSTKVFEPSSQGNSNLTCSVLKKNSKQNLYGFVQKMDFIKPLKVPDLKIAPKILDFSGREGSVSKETSSTKSEVIPKEYAQDKSDKIIKGSERVQRKLDFSVSDGSSIINCESIESLKAPNVSIASNLNKKKEHVRDSFKEKENKSKRIRKDNSYPQKDESIQHQRKCNKSSRHLSRKDAGSMSSSITTRLRNDKSTKSKTKTFITSTVKKDNEKRQKFLDTQSMKLIKDNPLEFKDRICNDESLVFQSWKVPDKVITRDKSNIVITSNNTENKPKDICHLRQVENLRYKCDSESKQLKQDKPNIIHKEQAKRITDKSKISNNKIEGKTHNINSETSEGITHTPETNSSRNHINVFPISSIQQSKNTDPGTIIDSKQDINSVKLSKSSDDFKYTENSVVQSTNTSVKQDEESYTQSTVTTKQTTDDSNDMDVSLLPETLSDPKRISFRDSSYSQQEEFHNLVTPEKMNLIIKSKRRRHLIQSSDSEVDLRSPKYKSMAKLEKEEEEIQLMHPAALHMQFQAELHLLDSFNESLRQVMDVEKCLYNTSHEQEQRNPKKENEKTEEIGGSNTTDRVGNNVIEKATWKSLDYMEDITEPWKQNACDRTHFNEDYISNQTNIDDSVNNTGKFNKGIVTVAEVQTQTVNDIATQTDIYAGKWNAQSRSLGVRRNIHERTFLEENEASQFSIDSVEQFEDLDQIEEMSLPSKIKTTSEISLHETTSSIKTETGTEISISTRDVTCSFNKYLDLEMAQLIKDEKQRYDKIEMLFKSREKTLNDRTRKLVRLEEQKRALRDTGQDSRISSVKKKQRALLLKLQQEKDEMNRLKELHKLASQQRKHMLQKQRNMFNPQMSTKNILTKLKRSADSQSPRRLSGPMKGYDIRSNSSMSSLVDSDKSHHDRSQVDTRLQGTESDIHLSKIDSIKSDKSVNLVEEFNTSGTRFDNLAESNGLQERSFLKTQKKDAISKHELTSRKYEEKMPRADILRLKSHQLDIESKLIQSHPINIKRFLKNQKPIEISQSLRPELDVSVVGFIKSGSDTLVEELSKRSRTSQIIDSLETAIVSKEKESESNIVIVDSESIEGYVNTKTQDTTRMTKSSQVSEDISQTNINKNSKKIDKSVISDRDIYKKQCTEMKANSKRKNYKCQKIKSSSDILTENILRSKSSSHISKELIKHYDKRMKAENGSFQLDNDDENSILSELDLNESQNSLQALVRHSKAVKDKNSKLLRELIHNYESKENVSSQALSKELGNSEGLSKNDQDTRNIPASQINTFAISQHSSGESEKNYIKSVVVRSQDNDLEPSEKLDQILTARETTLASRKNFVEELVTWHAKLIAEEDRVARMEQAAFKLVAASSILSQQDSTISSDTSDVEGRIELLTEKLAERRIEMSRLKREAKKQAKQKLRTLEANLLNQIKRYDTTIHEMRKKLESKKILNRDSDKLAIEPKSLADFKVPEIPLKRIQDIYKNSDLLRSKSESDLLLAKNQQKNSLKVLNTVTYNDKNENNDIQELIKSTNIKDDSELKTVTSTNYSVQSTFDECISTKPCDKPHTITSISPISNNTFSEKYTVSILNSGERELEVITTPEINSTSHNVQDVQMNISTVKSELDTQTISSCSENYNTINTGSAANRSINTNIDQSQTKLSITELEIQEEEDYPKSIQSEYDLPSESVINVTTVDSNRDMLIFSKKLNFLQLNNKNLNDGISSLENELKALSEMMSRFSKKSNEKSETDNNERSTLQDMSELISKSVSNGNILNINTEEKKTSGKEINSESFSIPVNDIKSYNDLSNDKCVLNRVNNETSIIVSKEALSLSNSAHDIDYEAKSKEIMNEIEKSIISEHAKIANDDCNTTSVLENDIQNLHKDNEELLHDLISLELDIKSVSQILSKVSESRESLNFATDSATQAIFDSEKAINEQNDSNEVKLNEDLVTDQTVAEHSLKLCQNSNTGSIHSPIIAGHRSVKRYKTNSQDKVKSTHSTILNSTSHILNSENLDLSEKISEAPQVEISTLDIKVPKELKCGEDIQEMVLDNTINSIEYVSNADQNQSHMISEENTSMDKNNWTTSDSFELLQNENGTRKKDIDFKDSKLSMDDSSKNISDAKDISCINDMKIQEARIKSESNIEDISIFIPKGESTNIEIQDISFNKTTEPYVMKSNDEFDDILDIITRESDKKPYISTNENRNFHNIIFEIVAELLDKVDDLVENNNVNIHLHDNEIDLSANNRNELVSDTSLLNNESQNKICVDNLGKNEIVFINTCNNIKFSNNQEDVINLSLQAVNKTDGKPAININVETDNEESLHEAASEAQEIVITELDSDSIEDQFLPELEIDAKVELAEEEESTTNAVNKDQYAIEGDKDIVPVKIQCLEPILEQDSSDGEQLDNLVEVAESGLDTIERVVMPLQASSKLTDEVFTQIEEAKKETMDNVTNTNTYQRKSNVETVMSSTLIADNINKTFDILKDPDYEDISEESLEVSEILDKNEFSKISTVKRSINLPEKYQITQKSEEVLRILDEISQKSSPDSLSNLQKNENDIQSAQSATEISELLDVEVSAEDDISFETNNITKNKTKEQFYKDESRNHVLKEIESQEERSIEAADDMGLAEEKRSGISLRLDDQLHDADEKNSQMIYELHERVLQLHEQDDSTESSEAGDTPRGVSEIEMDSPRDFNDSRLDIDILDDDLLSGSKTAIQSVDVKTNFHSASIVATSEKDIETMIDKLKASLEQPGLEVAELEAKLLRIEQLQIELEIKKLEAEEVSYYVREIPNKPPPPYTPPGDGRLSTSLGSPSLLTAVIPSNVEELTTFTEKATTLIHNAKMSGQDIANLEAPSEIYELTKEKYETVRKDRRIYNTFLFDLCKETIADIYRAEYEKPGPSWTKPNVKTKPMMKIPKTVEELTEYVSKEVATLFGFKTKLQRENMVMRWSRKRRDRVDELLAREAQAEEDEWTKFHHDELAVKNGLTVAILDTLIMETANVVKIAYGKKRKLMV